MKSTVTVQVDTDTLLKMIRRLNDGGKSPDMSEAVNAAIEFWLFEQAKLATGCDPANVRGYQWKSLFLPEGTVLRSWSYGDHNYARVEGDQIIHEGKSVSPNQFAQSFARTTRNAWTDLYVRRPEDKQFKPASRLRRELAQQVKQAPRPAPVATSSMPDAMSALLIAALQPQPVPHAAQAATPIAARDPTPGVGWNLPERRKFRFRLEDVAFD